MRTVSAFWTAIAATPTHAGDDHTWRSCADARTGGDTNDEGMRIAA